MRDAFVEELIKLAANEPNLILITADLGFGVFEKFETSFPDQYINCGVAEQLMTGIATGLALEGKVVFTYSIGNFPTFRCLEQIRNGAAYHECNVNIVSVGGGFSYGQLGMSHHATEDIAVMRAIPNVEVIVPSTLNEVKTLTSYCSHNKSRVNYLRLDKTVLEERQTFEEYKTGKLRKLNDGDDAVIVCAGGISKEALLAAENLKSTGVNVAVFSCTSIKPIDIEGLSDLFMNFPIIFSLEEHNIIGGLGSTIAEILAEQPHASTRLCRFGLNDEFSSIVGDANFLRNHYKINAKNIELRIIEELHK